MNDISRFDRPNFDDQQPPPPSPRRGSRGPRIGVGGAVVVGGLLTAALLSGCSDT